MDTIERPYGLLSIRNRILVFALLITLIPSFGMGWLLNNMMHATVTEKSEQKLRHATNIIEREITLWFKERNYDLYVFSNSFIIAENYSRFLTSRQIQGDEGSIYIRAIETYLSSVKNQFEDYIRLFVFDNKGVVVASSHSGENLEQPQLPEDVDKQIEGSRYIRGEVYFDSDAASPLIMIGTPLYSEQFNEHVGILAIEVRLNGILDILQSALVGIKWDTEMYGSLLRLNDGTHFLTTNKDDTAGPQVTSSAEVLQYFDGLLKLQDFENHLGHRVVGILSPISQLQWGIIVAENYDDVFARVTESRNRNILIVCFLGLLIGILAYLVARQIITPLKALTEGAQRVADGDLEVELPLKNNDELGLATRVFNEMVDELNQSQTKLEQMATTDSLTKLANRKQIMQTLHTQFDYYRRYKVEFSILMIDIDHFKKINDTYGHLAGDAVLQEIGDIFKETLRSVDSAGRYGGEEFLVILAESGEEDARQVAERIRLAVSGHSFVHDGNTMAVSVSVGAAQISQHDRDENNLISRADEALYQAKNRGRNRVVFIADKKVDEKSSNKVISLVRTAEK